MAFWSIDGGRGLLPLLSVELDVTNAPTNPTRVWTDITPDFRAIDYTRGGRNDELQRTSPGTFTGVVTSARSKYDTSNPAGIGIRRTQWLRVRAQWAGVVYPRWQGLIETISLGWLSAGRNPIATIRARDASKALNLLDLQGQTFAAQTSDQRLAAICALGNLTASTADTGASTLVAVQTAMPKESWASTHLQQVEETENGLIFAGPDGSIVFQSRHFRIVNSMTPKGVIGDGPGQIPYKDDVTVESDDAYIYNLAAVTPTNADGSLGVTQFASDPSSPTNHFPRRLDRTILVSDPGEALACAQFLMLKYAEPSPRVPTVSLLGAKNTAQWPTILAAGNSDRFTFQRSAYSPITEDCFVEQIGESIRPGITWNVKAQLSPADTAVGWLLGDSVYGDLGTTSVLTY